MRTLIFITVILLASLAAAAALPSQASPASPASQARDTDKSNATALQPGSLCSPVEHIIFSCTTKATAKHPAKIVSLCASRDLAKERGYLQYRFGLPGSIELEFPKGRQGTQQQFQYSHYIRYKVDLTEINFDIDDYQYQIFDNYNGEEKQSVTEQGVYVTSSGKSKDVTFVCRGKAKSDFSSLEDVLPREKP
jgi:hypothetical protein